MLASVMQHSAGMRIWQCVLERRMENVITSRLDPQN